MGTSVATAMALVDRAAFLPRAERHRAGHDGPLPLGHGQTCSQPRTVADMLELLDVRPGHRVLDVGSGSGWTTALLAVLAGPSGSVRGVERVPELVASGREALARFLAGPALRGRTAPASIGPALPGVLGLPDEAPFDRVLVSAEPPVLPAELVAQLAGGGVLVIPVAGRMLRVVRDEDEPAPTVTEHGWYRFVPLVRD